MDNSGAENHTTIFTIAESPLDANIIWVGTDDGNVQVTKDGGKWINTWKIFPTYHKTLGCITLKLVYMTLALPMLF